MVGNAEYRIPIIGPVVLAAFVDVGMNRILFPNQLAMEPTRLNDLNAMFPTAAFGGKAVVIDSTQKPRMSTGLELQVMLPMVNAPFRFYWAYNPVTLREWIQPPIVADRSQFANQATFLRSVAQFGRPYPWFEKQSMFRFTISRTF